MNDVKMIKNSENIFDISFQSNGDFVLESGVDTAVNISLLTDDRASSQEVPTPEFRRGFWGSYMNPDSYSIGSKFWVVNNKRTQENLNRYEDYSFKSLEWLIDGNIFDRIETSATFLSEGLVIDIDFIADNQNESKQIYLGG